MPTSYDSLINWSIPELEQSYGPADCILYSLGIGIGANPLDPEQLTFVTRKNLRAFPTMAVGLASPDLWLSDPRTGIDFTHVVHGGQDIYINRPLATSGTLISKTRVTDVIDKGEGRGLIVVTERKLYDKADGALFSTLISSFVARANGRLQSTRQLAPPHEIPTSREPTLIVDTPIPPNLGLVFHLTGDYVDFHVYPKAAAEFNFNAPPLHGVCLLGLAAWTVVANCCRSDPLRLQAFGLRFTAPAFPGETLRTEIWIEGLSVSFRTSSLDRKVLILNNGWAKIGAN
jgi:acyl dehydratase